MTLFFNTAKKVDRGALLLDDEMPGWYQNINFDELDFDTPRFDILGQLYGHTALGRRNLHLYTPEDFADHGFTIRLDLFFPGIRHWWLTRFWRKAVKSRLSGDHLFSDGMLSASEHAGTAF